MKPLLIGEAPSRKSDPKKPFQGASGRRLARMAGLDSEEDLPTRFRMTNVLGRWPGTGNAGEKGSRFPIARAKRAARRIELLGVVILAGRRVAKAFGMAEAPYFRWYATDRHGPCRIAVIPHPSGCNQFYNVPANREKVAAFLRGVLACGFRAAA